MDSLVGVWDEPEHVVACEQIEPGCQLVEVIEPALRVSTVSATWGLSC